MADNVIEENVIDKIQVKGKEYSFGIKYDSERNIINETYFRRDEMPQIEEVIRNAQTATSEAEKVDATITDANVLEVTGRDGMKKSLELASQADAATIKTELAKKFDKKSVAQEFGDSEELVMSQKSVSDKLVDLSNKKLSKDSDSDSSVSDGSEEFVVIDAANKVAFRVDNEGAKAKILNICDKNGKVVKTITEKETIENSEDFSIIDLKGNKSFSVDSEGTKARKYNICDENGKVVKIITDELLDNIEQNKQNNLWWKDKNIFLLGDSLGQIRDIQRVFSQYSMSNWYTEYVSAVLSAGGTQTLSRYTLDASGDERASYLKQINESRGINIDVIFFMTNNDAASSFVKNDGNKSQEPYYESQILRNLDVALSKENFRNEFNERFSEIIGNAQTKNTSALTWGTKVTWSEKGNVTPKGQSILFVPIEYDNVNTYILKINKAANVNGSVKIKSNVSGFKENTITIKEGDSIEEILNKILICDFGTVLDLKSSDTEISFTNTLHPNTNNITLESSSDDINNIFTLSNSVGTGYIETPIVYKSLDTTNWNNSEYWVLRDTEYTPEFSPESSKFGPSAWQVYSGIIQYLQMTFPRALIIGLYPTIGWGKMDSYKYNNSDFINYSKFRTDYQNRYNYDRHRALMKEIFNYYCCPFIDFNECSGISAVNAIPGGFYPPDGNIHPYQGDNGGSARWGVTLANVLL